MFAGDRRAFQDKMITFPFLILFWAINSLALLTSRALLRRLLGGIRKYGRKSTLHGNPGYQLESSRVCPTAARQTRMGLPQSWLCG